MASNSPSQQGSQEPAYQNGSITEDEASLYDRQIRLWGLEAQNRMRSSTVLVLSLRSLSHEVIKNLVLAGIGRLIVMDGESVTEEDLGSGFLFREEDGAVGRERTAAALPQIASLNPLVSLTALPTLSPFIPAEGVSAEAAQDAMVDLLQSNKVDVVLSCDLSRAHNEGINAAARKAGSKFYCAGTYGFYGYVFADLGDNFDYVVTPPVTPGNPSPSLQKKTASFAPLSTVLDQANWSLPAPEAAKGGSPFRGLTRSGTKAQLPALPIGILSLWEFEKRHGDLPTAANLTELAAIAEELRVALGVNTKALPSVDAGMIEHLSTHATDYFPPTLAILGGLLAQDILRALSLKDTPIANLLAVDTLGGAAVVSRWGMAPAANA